MADNSTGAPMTAEDRTLLEMRIFNLGAALCHMKRKASRYEALLVEAARATESMDMRNKIRKALS